MCFSIFTIISSFYFHFSGATVFVLLLLWLFIVTRIDIYFTKCYLKHSAKFRRRWKGAGQPPHNVTAFKGNVHAIVSRGFVEYVLHDKRATDLLYWVSKTVIPDETYFTTLNYNPSLQVPGKLIPRTVISQ